MNDRKQLEQILENNLMHVITNSKKCYQMYNYANDAYNIPKSKMADIICQRVILSELDDYLLFVVLDTYEKTNGIKKTIINDYYKKRESKANYVTKYECKTINIFLVNNDLLYLSNIRKNVYLKRKEGTNGYVFTELTVILNFVKDQKDTFQDKILEAEDRNIVMQLINENEGLQAYFKKL